MFTKISVVKGTRTLISSLLKTHIFTKYIYMVQPLQPTNQPSIHSYIFIQSSRLTIPQPIQTVIHLVSQTVILSFIFSPYKHNIFPSNVSCVHLFGTLVTCLQQKYNSFFFLLKIYGQKKFISFCSLTRGQQKY